MSESATDGRTTGEEGRVGESNIEDRESMMEDRRLKMTSMVHHPSSILHPRSSPRLPFSPSPRLSLRLLARLPIILDQYHELGSRTRHHSGFRRTVHPAYRPESSRAWRLL